jgi:hypothetical protein
MRKLELDCNGTLARESADFPRSLVGGDVVSRSAPWPPISAKMVWGQRGKRMPIGALCPVQLGYDMGRYPQLSFPCNSDHSQ